MIQRNHMMSAHRLSDVRHSQLLGSLSFLPARRELLAAAITSTSLGALRFRFHLGTLRLFSIAAVVSKYCHGWLMRPTRITTRKYLHAVFALIAGTIIGRRAFAVHRALPHGEDVQHCCLK